MGVRKRGNGRAGVVYLDTHSAVWLASGTTDWLTKKASQALDLGDLRISPIVVLELQLMREKKRIATTVNEMLSHLLATAGVQVCDLPWISVVEAACEVEWTRDPCDRLIVAHAALQGAQLITRDEVILRNYERALC